MTFVLLIGALWCRFAVSYLPSPLDSPLGRSPPIYRGMDRAISTKIKAATVAVGLLQENAPGCPFVIAGSGFCVDVDGVVVTCRHVVECFNKRSFAEALKALPSDQPSFEMEGARPHIFFFHPETSGKQLWVFPVPVEAGSVMTDFDLAVVRFKRHAVFRDGYPTLKLADYGEVYEGAECGTCGFPLGGGLREQLGTHTSSFTFGRLSSVLPAQGVALEYLIGFQLDMTATHGNSGGPVFLVGTGHVFGVLQRGIFGSDGTTILPGDGRFPDAIEDKDSHYRGHQKRERLSSPAKQIARGA